MTAGSIEKVSSFKAWLYLIGQDQTSVRAIRFSVGVTILVALAYGINWPLSFLLPVLVAVLLAMPLPMPSLMVGLGNMKNTIMAFIIGLVFSLFFLQYPFTYILMLGLVLFHLYYYLNRGGSFWLTLMSMIAILLLPMLANSGEGLAIGFSFGFVLSGCLTVLMVWLSQLLGLIFSGKSNSKYYGSAFTALLVLVNGSMAEGANFSELLTNRIRLILLATVYIVVALKILDSYRPLLKYFRKSLPIVNK